MSDIPQTTTAGAVPTQDISALRGLLFDMMTQLKDKTDGTAATWDLSSVSSGSVDFMVAVAGTFEVSISGGTASKIAHFALLDIP